MRIDAPFLHIERTDIFGDQILELLLVADITHKEECELGGVAVEYIVNLTHIVQRYLVETAIYLAAVEYTRIVPVTYVGYGIVQSIGRIEIVTGRHGAIIHHGYVKHLLIEAGSIESQPYKFKHLFDVIYGRGTGQHHFGIVIVIRNSGVLACEHTFKLNSGIIAQAGTVYDGVHHRGRVHELVRNGRVTSHGKCRHHQLVFLEIGRAHHHTYAV